MGIFAKKSLDIDEEHDYSVLSSEKKLLLNEVLLKKNDKVSAIREVRRITDWDLRKAKDFVERNEYRSGFKATVGRDTVSDTFKNKNITVNTVNIINTADVFSEEDRIRINKALSEKGNIIAAIKEIRNITGWDLKKSKDFVENNNELPVGSTVNKSVTRKNTDESTLELVMILDSSLSDTEKMKKISKLYGINETKAKELIEKYKN